MRNIDHTKFGPNGPPGEAEDRISRRWWSVETDDEAVESVSAALTHLQRRQAARITQHVIGARLYGNLSLLGFGGLGFLRLAGASGILRERISYNVVQSALDTVTAKIGKNRPRPLFLTSGGDYRMQRKAKKLNQFVEGVFSENRAYDLGPLAFRDGGVFGDGVVHVFAENGQVRFERTLSSELWVDELEAFYGEPRSMHRVKNVDRGVLVDMVEQMVSDKTLSKEEGEKALRFVREASCSRPDESGAYQSLSDLVTVRESWHLASGPDSEDGKHMLSLHNGVLWSGPYERKRFPFARFRWCPRLYGYWSQGLAEQLQNIQLEINKLLQLIQRSFHLGGAYKVLLENTSKVVAEHLNNDVGAIIHYTGTKPEYVVPPMVSPEIFQHLLTLKNAAFEQAGVSMLSAVSQKPAGLNSGKALREYNDIESDRFMTIGHEYEAFFLDLARLSIETAKEIGPRYSARAPGKKFLREIRWGDVNLTEDQYVMQVYPVSSLPRDPAGRLQTIQELMQAGLLEPRRGRQLLDFPDIDQVENLQGASQDYLEKILEQIIDDGVYTPPEPYDDLTLARELALEQYAWGKTQGLEEERLELLRRFLGQIDALEQAAQPPPSPGQPGTPQASPAPPPQSDLIRNVPGAQGAPGVAGPQ